MPEDPRLRCRFQRKMPWKYPVSILCHTRAISTLVSKKVNSYGEGLCHDIHKNPGYFQRYSRSTRLKTSVLHQFVNKGLSNVGRYAVALFDERFVLQNRLRVVKRGQISPLEEFSDGYLVTPHQ